MLLASMPAVQDRPRQASAPLQKASAADPPERELLYAPWPDPQQGVIEEARRRQRRRRRRLAIAAVIAVSPIAVVGALIGGSQANPAHPGPAARGSAASGRAASAMAFNIRLAPVLEVGRAGWQVFYEEGGAQVAGGATGTAVSSDAYLSDEGGSRGGSPLWTTRIVTTPNVASILTEGRTRVPTVPLPGLPYGYRAARILTPIKSTETPVEPDGDPRPGGRGPRSLVALDAEGQPIGSKPQRETPAQAMVRSWDYPGRTPEGSCGLRASPMPGLTAQGGRVATAIRPYTASGGGQQIVGHAFLPCVSVEYHLQDTPLRALILLDAAHPSARAAMLPDFNPVSGTPGFFDQGGLTAKREGNTWLIVAQGSGVAQRVELLRHLTALVKLDSFVPASSGVASEPPTSRRPPGSSSAFSTNIVDFSVRWTSTCSLATPSESVGSDLRHGTTVVCPPPTLDTLLDVRCIGSCPGREGV